MARRTYTRDAGGRFASSGGGGGGNKAAASRKANTARAASLRASGTTAIGGRLKAKGFVGGKSAQKNAGGLRSAAGRQSFVKGTGQPGRTGGGAISGRVKRDSNVGAKVLASAAKRANKARSKAGQRGKNMATTSKSAPNAAKAKYKELNQKVRQGKRWSAYGVQDGRAGAGAKSSLDAMVRNRGARKAVPKAVQAIAKAAAASYAAGQTARAMMTGRRRKR